MPSGSAHRGYITEMQIEHRVPTRAGLSIRLTRLKPRARGCRGPRVL